MARSGALGTDIESLSSGRYVQFDPPPDAGGVALALCFTTNAYDPDAVVWTLLTSVPFSFIFVSEAPMYTATNAVQNHTLKLTLDREFGIASDYTYLSLSADDTCAGPLCRTPRADARPPRPVLFRRTGASSTGGVCRRRSGGWFRLRGVADGPMADGGGRLPDGRGWQWDPDIT